MYYIKEQKLLTALILSSLFVLTSTAYSAEESKARLLVIPLKAQIGIKSEEAVLLSDILSVELHRSGKFIMLNRDDMKSVLDEKEFELAMGCDDNVCLLENVAKLSVNKIITGNIGRLGKKYIISIRMINKDGENEMMERESCVCEIDELDGTIEKILRKFLKHLGGDVVRYGSIRVESVPRGARIFLDGVNVGTCPDTIGRIDPGTHSISVKKDGYGSWSKSVDVEKGDVVSVTAELAKGNPEAYKEPATGMEFVLVKGGCYEMGDTFGDGKKDEKPVHEVCVDGFYIGKYEVTVGEFRRFVNDTGYRADADTGGGMYVWIGNKWEKQSGRGWRSPGFSQTDNHPVVGVSWNDAQKYINWLNRKSGKSYRLPTEAEWEYAARSGGKRYKYSWGNGSLSGNIADEAANRKFNWTIWEGYDDGYAYTAPVGSYRSNMTGLYDMTGNVWEWCQDIYSKDAYRKHQRNNPVYRGSGSNRIDRGGSWGSKPGSLRASFRGSYTPDYRRGTLGFRLARTP